MGCRGDSSDRLRACWHCVTTARSLSRHSRPVWVVLALILRCHRCSQAINFLGGKVGTCPRCKVVLLTLTAASSPPSDPRAATGAKHPTPNPDAVTSKAKVLPPTSSSAASGPSVVPHSLRSRPDIPRGRPGDHRPVDHAVCWFCEGRGLASGRTCSRCQGFGYLRSISATEGTVYASSNRDLTRLGARSPLGVVDKQVVGPVVVALCPESEMTPEVMREAQRLISGGWRPFDIRPELLFRLKDTSKTKSVSFQVWSAMYRMKGAGPAANWTRPELGRHKKKR